MSNDNTKGFALLIAVICLLIGGAMAIQQCSIAVGHEYTKDPSSVILGFFSIAAILILIIRYAGKK